MILSVTDSVWSGWGVNSYKFDIDDCSLLDSFDLATNSKPVKNINLESKTDTYVMRLDFDITFHPFEINIVCTNYKYDVNNFNSKFVAYFISLKDKSTTEYGTTFPNNNLIPEVLIISNGKDICVYRVYTIYEASDNYRGEIFGVPGTFMFWLKREPELRLIANEFTYERFEDIIKMFKIDFETTSGADISTLNRGKLMMYNIFSSLHRFPHERNSKLPPIEI